MGLMERRAGAPLALLCKCYCLKPCWAPRSRPFHHPTLCSWSKQTALCYFYSMLSAEPWPVHGAGAVPEHGEPSALWVQHPSGHSRPRVKCLHRSFLFLCLYNNDFQLCENPASSGRGIKASPEVLVFAKPCTGHFPQPSPARCLGGEGELLME